MSGSARRVDGIHDGDHLSGIGISGGTARDLKGDVITEGLGALGNSLNDAALLLDLDGTIGHRHNTPVPGRGSYSHRSTDAPGWTTFDDAVIVLAYSQSIRGSTQRRAHVALRLDNFVVHLVLLLSLPVTGVGALRRRRRRGTFPLGEASADGVLRYGEEARPLVHDAGHPPAEVVADLVRRPPVHDDDLAVVGVHPAAETVPVMRLLVDAGLGRYLLHRRRSGMVVLAGPLPRGTYVLPDLGHQILLRGRFDGRAAHDPIHHVLGGARPDVAVTIGR
mmetsp:Transcript_22224/g.52668  ORF Transcript_22224/g.52668 Transcript_22224/m.52668 type:complete len:278 (+) Transcript_22224:2047-2880(+)